ncbi:MAG: hypothetical protein OXP73_09075 [Chloroflexota bacterium]|nr:hypothetical protein [Chloroflexota bacterium]
MKKPSGLLFALLLAAVVTAVVLETDRVLAHPPAPEDRNWVHAVEDFDALWSEAYTRTFKLIEDHFIRDRLSRMSARETLVVFQDLNEAIQLMEEISYGAQLDWRHLHRPWLWAVLVHAEDASRMYQEVYFNLLMLTVDSRRIEAAEDIRPAALAAKIAAQRMFRTLMVIQECGFDAYLRLRSGVCWNEATMSGAF